MKTQLHVDQLIEELEQLLQMQQANGWEKLSRKIALIEQFDQKQFFYVFAICSRWFESLQTIIPPGSFDKADPYNVLQKWSWISLARLYLLLLLSQKNEMNRYISLYKELCHNADVQESIVLIQSLAFLPQANAFIDNAREAARSNITSLFSAIAHNNNYAFNYFDPAGWNQLILKAAFMAVPIWSIVGLKKRNSSSLVIMLKDYARERQAASRTVPWDLWCCVAWAAETDEDIHNLIEQFNCGNTQTQAAITLALMENSTDQAQQCAAKLAQQKDLQILFHHTPGWNEIAQLTDHKNTIN